MNAVPLGWRSVFALSAAAGLLAPYALRVLPKREPRSGDRLDLLGGALLGLAVGGALLAMTQASRGAWDAPHVVAAAIGSVVAAVLLVLRQRRARSPFVPRELLRNRRYVLLTAIAFLVATGDLVVLTGVPLALVEVGEASAAQVGLALLPGSLLPILLTPLAGRLVDRIGASVPIVTGILAMLGGTLLLSITGGVPLGVAAALFALQAAGIAILGPTIIATVSLVVPPRVLNTAMGLTEMSRRFRHGARHGRARGAGGHGARDQSAPYGSSAGLQRRLPRGGAPAAHGPGVRSSARGKWAIGGGGRTLPLSTSAWRMLRCSLLYTTTWCKLLNTATSFIRHATGIAATRAYSTVAGCTAGPTARSTTPALSEDLLERPHSLEAADRRRSPMRSLSPRHSDRMGSRRRDAGSGSGLPHDR